MVEWLFQGCATYLTFSTGRYVFEENQGNFGWLFHSRLAKVALALNLNQRNIMSILKEFKEFAMRGNVVDLAVGVVIGAAFGKIVTSLVNDIIMPPIGKMTGGVDFKDKFINLDHDKLASYITAHANTPGFDPNHITLAQAKEASATVIAYGSFFSTILDFIIVAFCIFLVVKAMNKLWKKPEEVPAGPTTDQKLLMEIRDLLKAKS